MATDQKIENLLNLALEATQGEREKSLELDVGYDRQEIYFDFLARDTYIDSGVCRFRIKCNLGVL